MNSAWSLGALPGMIGGSTLNKAGSGFSDFLFGSPERQTQIQRFRPDQISAQQQLIQQALQGLQNPMQGFAPIAQQARSQFQSQTVPSIAERFTSMGQGAQRSSGFQQALGSAGAGLEESLAALSAQYGQGQQSFLAQLLGLGLTPQFESIYQPSQLGSAQAFGGSLFSQSMPSIFSSLNMMGQNKNMADMQTSKNQQLDKILGFLKQNPNTNMNAFQNFI
jgi:hypothetical protein